MEKTCAGSETSSVLNAKFPALSKQATGLFNGVVTEVTSMTFADKILVTISQGGRLSQWIEVPLNSTSSNLLGNALPSDNQSDILPLIHLTPKTLLGGGGDERERVGHFFAIHIANRIVSREPNESRSMILGLGLEKIELSREAFFDMMELISNIV